MAANDVTAKPTCPFCKREFRSADTLRTHLEGPPGKPEKAWHQREQAKAGAQKILDKPVEKIRGNTMQALQEAASTEEQRRKAAALVKKPRDAASLPAIPYRVRFTWDTMGRTDEEIRDAAKAFVKELKVSHPKARIDIEAILPLI